MKHTIILTHTYNKPINLIWNIRCSFSISLINLLKSVSNSSITTVIIIVITNNKHLSSSVPSLVKKTNACFSWFGSYTSLQKKQVNLSCSLFFFFWVKRDDMHVLSSFRSVTMICKIYHFCLCRWNMIGRLQSYLPISKLLLVIKIYINSPQYTLCC